MKTKRKLPEYGHVGPTSTTYDDPLGAVGPRGGILKRILAALPAGLLYRVRDRTIMEHEPMDVNPHVGANGHVLRGRQEYRRYAAA